MIFTIKTAKYAFVLLAIGLVISGCQKMERPELKELILDPPPPPYADLKSFWSFENNLADAGESKLTATPVGVSYVAGVTGQAAQIGAGGYILLKTFSDTVKYTNGYKSLPKDTLSNLGSFTLAFWMKGAGPVKDGAQGLFAISHKTEFWGNLELFLENNDNGAEGFLKIHMFNAAVATGNGEEWNELKIPNMLNKWTHVALRYDGNNSQLTLMIDGAATSINNKVLGGGNYGKIKFKDFNGMVLGSYAFQTAPSLTNHGPESWAKSFNGALDQFRLYNRPLSNAEITDLFTTKK